MFKRIGATVFLMAFWACVPAAQAEAPSKSYATQTLKPGEWLFDQKVEVNGKRVKDYSYIKDYCLDQAYPLGAAVQKALASDDGCVSRILGDDGAGIEFEVTCPGSKTVGKAKAINENKFVYNGNTKMPNGVSANTEISMTFKKASCSNTSMNDENPIETRLHDMQCKQVKSRYASIKARCASLAGDNASGCQQQVRQMEEFSKTCP